MKYLVTKENLDGMFAYLHPIFAPAQLDALNAYLVKILEQVVDTNPEKSHEQKEQLPLDEGFEKE